MSNIIGQVVNEKIQLMIAQAPVEIVSCQIGMAIAVLGMCLMVFLSYVAYKIDKDSWPLSVFVTLLVSVFLVISFAINYTEFIAIKTNPEAWANEKVFDKVLRLIGGI